jgi:MmpS family membrane protein
MLMKRFRRYWLPLVVVMAFVVGGLVIERMHGIFGSDNEVTRQGSGIANDAKPFSPKRVTYEVFGPVGAVATINYLDLSANPQSLKQVPLPWTLTLTTTAPATSPILLAQGDAQTIGCRITIDGKVKDEKSAEGVDAFTFCQVKSA